MKIFAVSGLGADSRVFDFLELNAELICIDWISPIEKEPIIEYSKRLISKYKLNEENDLIIMGVSFGGLVATEISKLLNPKLSIIIASVATRSMLPGHFKLISPKIVDYIPLFLLDPPRILAHYVFDSKNKQLLSDILDDSDLNFTRWAIREVLIWQNKTLLSPVLRIDAENDKIFTKTYSESVKIKNAGHFMIVDRAIEISRLINDRISQV